MEQDYGTPIPPYDETPAQPPKKNNTILIIVIVLVVLCCCCLLAAGGLGYWLYTNGDQMFSDFMFVLPALTV